jgi:hypothetical protein
VPKTKTQSQHFHLDGLSPHSGLRNPYNGAHGVKRPIHRYALFSLAGNIAKANWLQSIENYGARKHSALAAR